MDYEHSSMAMNAICHAASMVQASIQQEISGYGEPSAIYRPKVFPDGNLWCALYGDNVQEGVCGVGDTPAAAIYDFNQCWHGLGKYRKAKELNNGRD